jgi:hypothetical protein
LGWIRWHNSWHALSGFWSRRINNEHRMVHTVQDEWQLQCWSWQHLQLKKLGSLIQSAVVAGEGKRQ